MQRNVNREVAKVSDPAVQRYAGFELRLVAFLLDLIVLFSFLMLFVAAAGLELLLSSDFGVEDPPDSALYAAAVILLVYFFAFVPLYSCRARDGHATTGGLPLLDPASLWRLLDDTLRPRAARPPR